MAHLKKYMLYSNVYDNLVLAFHGQRLICLIGEYASDALKTLDQIKAIHPENTYWKGEDHCLAVLQFKKTGFDQKRKYVCICMF